MRYHVFWGDTYYPGRALRDYVASFDTEEEGRLRELDMGEFPFLVDE
jgi:hypothetical protein